METIQAVGQTYKNFTITKYLPLEELQSTLIEAVHTVTGAKIMHIANQDVENLFCLSFPTYPSSSNGVAHILEHMVLCGSKKFPVKDPFFAMTRRSLNTYMNALTGQDFTCYPASSQIEKDFYNLLAVYLDAVFYPDLKPLSFAQEGHRLEYTEPKDPKSGLCFQGIVFNEMKGALANPESRLWESVLKYLTPDLTYCHNSGGDPKNIPDLTYQELKSFHETFYHPSHCLFFFYGNIPLSKHLDFIEENVLKNFSKVAPLAPINLQKKFSKPVFAEEFYPIASKEKLNKKHFICLSFLTEQIIHQEETLALCLLESLLLDHDASCLKKALLKSRLCTSVDSSVDIEMSQIPFSILCKGCDKNDKEKIQKIIFQTLENCSFTEDEIEGCLQGLEFERTEIGSGGMPFGLTLFFKAGLIKQHGSNPENALLIHSLFNDLREKLKNPSYLRNLIDKYFLKNPHYLVLVMSPDPELDAKEKQQENERLKKLEKEVNPEEILKQTENLEKYQHQTEHQVLDCLPKLTLKDVPEKTIDFPLHKETLGFVDIFHHDVFTNKILYADLVIDLEPLPEDLLPLLSIYSKFVTELGFGSQTYEDCLHFQQAHTGEFYAQIGLFPSSKNPNILKPSLCIRGKCLYRFAEKLFELFSQLLEGANLTEKHRIQELLSEHVTLLEQKINKSALSYASQLAMQGFNKPSQFQEKLSGLYYYNQVLNFAKDFDGFVKKLQDLQKMILNFEKLSLILSCDRSMFDQIKKTSFYNRLNKKPTIVHKQWDPFFEKQKIESQARIISSSVAFTVQGFSCINVMHKDSAYLCIATELLSNCYLHTSIREKGGAYGSGASYSPVTGNFHFYAYRDPNLSRTLQEFTLGWEKICRKDFTDQELEEAKLGVIQALDTPVTPANRAFTAFGWEKSERSLQNRQEFRQNILKATKEDIALALKTHIQPTQGVVVSFLGEALLQKEIPKLQTPLKTLTVNS